MLTNLNKNEEEKLRQQPEKTRVIWVRMIKRPKTEGDWQELFALRGKFNSILEERIYEDSANFHRIMSIDIPATEVDFLGNISPHGKTTFWKEVIRALKKLNLGEISLNARKPQNTESTNAVSALQGSRSLSDPKPQLIRHLERMSSSGFNRKLPTPPKSRRRLSYDDLEQSRKTSSKSPSGKSRKRSHTSHCDRHSSDRHNSYSHKDSRHSSPTKKRHRH